MLDYTLHKDIPVPLYYQLKLQLLADIQEGRLHVGDMIPPECEISKVLHVSRPTVRQALTELVAEGHLVRFKGKGSFVSEPLRPPVDARFFQNLKSFNEEMLQKGLVPSTRVLALERVSGRGEIAKALMLREEAHLIRLSRLRFADGEPLVVVETFLPYARFRRLMEEDFATNSLYDLLEQRYGLRVDHARRQFEAAAVVPEDAVLLDMDAGRPICRVRTLAFAKGEPVEYSIARYRGDRNVFTVELYR